MRYIFSTIVLTILSFNAISGCECYSDSNQKTFRKAKAIFVGKLISIGTERIEREGYSPLHKLTFEIEQSWKGTQIKQITIVTNYSNMCSAFEFREGEKYLLNVRKNSYVTSECASSKEFSSESAQNLIKDLDSFWFRLKSRLWII